MKFFTASLLAASAFALTETYDLINEDSIVNLIDPSLTWSGQYMTLTTTVDGDEIEFCLNAIAPNSADDTGSTFSVSWSDGIEYSAENYDLEFDVVSFMGGLVGESWTNVVLDVMQNASTEEGS